MNWSGIGSDMWTKEQLDEFEQAFLEGMRLERVDFVPTNDSMTVLIEMARKGLDVSESTMTALYEQAVHDRDEAREAYSRLERFLMRVTGPESGTITGSVNWSATEISIARDQDRMVVLDDNTAVVYTPVNPIDRGVGEAGFAHVAKESNPGSLREIRLTLRSRHLDSRQNMFAAVNPIDRAYARAWWSGHAAGLHDALVLVQDHELAAAKPVRS